MKQRVMAICRTVLYFILASISALTAQHTRKDEQHGFTFGIEWTSCRNLFILTKFDIAKIEGTYYGYTITAGYSWYSESGIGAGIGLLFTPLPCKDFEYGRGSDGGLEPYTNVSYQFILTEPSLRFQLYDRLKLDIYFLLGMGLSYYDVKMPTGRFSIDETLQSTYRTDFQGGAGIGLRYPVTRRVIVTLDYRLMLGTSEGAEYDLWINGVNTGSTGGEGNYSKIISIGARYWF